MWLKSKDSDSDNYDDNDNNNDNDNDNNDNDNDNDNIKWDGREATTFLLLFMITVKCYGSFWLTSPYIFQYLFSRKKI